MSNAPLPGHWRRDDGAGSAEHFGLTAELVPGVLVNIDEKFEDEVPVASPVPIQQPTPEELAAQLVNAPTPVPPVSSEPSVIGQVLTELETMGPLIDEAKAVSTEELIANQEVQS